MSEVTGRFLLAADLGGTKTLLELGHAVAGNYAPLRAQRFENAEFASLEAVLRSFLQKGPAVDAACIAVAGPVVNDCATVTNLPWEIDASVLSAELGGAQVRLINDFEAVSYGVEHVPPSALVTLQAGCVESAGVRAVMGAGTGLGEGFVVTCNGIRIAHASEGGHTDFAPRTAAQWRLLQFLNARFEHVSYERVLSGQGLVHILEFLRAESFARETVLPEPAAITAMALAQPDSLEAQAVTIFIDVLGAEAGNLALKTMPTGGVYIAGGIAPKMLSLVTDGKLISAFSAKGRMRPLMARFPVHVVTDLDVGLKGAVSIARQLIAR